MIHSDASQKLLRSGSSQGKDCFGFAKKCQQHGKTCPRCHLRALGEHSFQFIPIHSNSIYSINVSKDLADGKNIGNFAKITDMANIDNSKIIDIVTDKIRGADNGTLFFSNSFPEYGDEYIGHIMSNLVKSGELYRIGRGVYLKTTSTRYGLVYPSIDTIAKAMAERDNAEILPTGAMALNILGLSTQVPMSPIFITSGSARVINIGGRNIYFKRAVPRNFAVKGKKRRLIVQALKAIGEKNMTVDDYEKIGTLIRKFKETDDFENDLKAMPTWIRRIFLKYSNN